MSALRADALIVLDDDLIRPRAAALTDVQHGLERTAPKP